MGYEYRVIPAPRRLKKIKRISATADLFAVTLTDAINAEARDGWEYLRSEALAAERPGGWFRRGAVVEETMMVFRRPRRQDPAREPASREFSSRDARRAEPALEARGPSEARPAEAERTRPLASLFARGEAPDPESQPQPRSRSGPSTPPLLRPVPRHKPGESS